MLEVRRKELDFLQKMCSEFGSCFGYSQQLGSMSLIGCKLRIQKSDAIFSLLSTFVCLCKGAHKVQIEIVKLFLPVTRIFSIICSSVGKSTFQQMQLIH